ncbi:sigma-70 family RNA polymerase sigma factor [Luteimonas viscosa]|uniref:Sigma-70 family RNA polymerase sigma factor n=1 Tax=Luteimonas viscosa TaxID=1132694 RepID=A0A5D4XRU7_9GAMM|nr:sigma-70 family RNA polymerase sigma factor [Luteimonas viscosa]TYT26663.1 sigma-70 family RNA polymerase sigma factor [Luteimonas viscosa]
MRRDSGRIFDEYLAASARAGDRVAWERLVARWHPRLLRHAWRLTGQPEQARDAVQDAWLEILRGIRGLDDAAAFPAWALRIVTRRCQRMFRDAGRERAGLAGVATDPTLAHALEPTGETAAELRNVLGAMSGLPAEQRAALSLYYLEHLGVAEIAVALDIPPGTVKTRLMHARRRIRARLEGAEDGQDR